MGALWGALTVRDRLRTAGVLEQAEQLATEHACQLADVIGSSRVQHIVRARHAVFALLQGRGLSASEIGRIFACHHTTILNGLRAHARRVAA